MNNYNTPDNPEFLNDYLVHIKLVQLLSERTIQGYYEDIRLFLRFIYMNNHNIDDIPENIDISDFPADDLRKITVSDIYNFIFYVSDERHNNDKARYRKISSLRSFFKYLEKAAHIIEKDPTKDLDVPVPKKSLPKFLSLNESMRLLQASDNADSKRDYCIITLFLNCGIRLSELVGINISDIDFYENRMKVLGKGNKERMIYLNEACIDALNKYLVIRRDNQKAKAEPALFISNQNKRISKRRVQQIVENTLTALTLKELLGHASVATTEIYTHLSNENVRNAIESNPLSKVKSDDKE